MSSTLGSILANREFNEPPEIQRVKKHINDQYKVIPKVSLQNDQLIIAVPSSALAGTLRMNIVQLEEVAATDKRIVIRIA